MKRKLIFLGIYMVFLMGSLPSFGLNSIPKSYAEDLPDVERKDFDATSLDHVSGLITASTALTLEGKVIDQNGEPLIGVNIQVQGTTTGTSTDFEGRFILEDISENAILVVSYIGFQTREIQLEGQSSIEIVLI